MGVTYIPIAGLLLSGGGDRPLQPPGAGLAALDHNGDRLLPPSCGRGHCAARHAGGPQHRPWGSQSTNQVFTGLLKNHGIANSMDGKTGTQFADGR